MVIPIKDCKYKGEHLQGSDEFGCRARNLAQGVTQSFAKSFLRALANKETYREGSDRR